MTLARRFAPAVVALTLCAAPAAATRASPGEAAADDEPTLARLRDAAMGSDWAWEQLSELADRIGPRMNGSPQLQAAIERLAGVLRASGAQVRLQPVAVPHWVRGIERASIVSYPGQVPGAGQALQLTALGGSAATSPEGLSAPVVAVADMDELSRRAGEVAGSIVVFTAKFDQRLAESGEADEAYLQSGLYRFAGPSVAARMGAAAVLVRSAGGAEFRLPHTGVTVWQSGQVPIPAAALAAEDADLLARLAAKGPVRVHLVLAPQTLPDTDSANLIADWPGREWPDQTVIVSAHLDSWDLGTGAIDDGAGVASAAAVIELMHRLDLHPRRTIRFIGWTDEEMRASGARAYLESVAGSLASQTAAIESDQGGGRALGFRTAVTRESLAALQSVARALAPIGATVVARRDDVLGPDIEGLQRAGVPGFAPLLDRRHYYDYHHTAADTLDKVDPQDLRSQVATLAVLAYYLADLPRPLPRMPVTQP